MKEKEESIIPSFKPKINRKSEKVYLVLQVDCKTIEQKWRLV